MYKKSVMHVQSCRFADLILLLFCPSRCRRRRRCSHTVDINCTDIDKIRDDTEEAPGDGRRRGGSAVLLGLEKMAENFTRYITNTLWSLALLHKFDTKLSEIFPGWGQVVSNKRNSFLNVIGNGGYVGTFVSHSFDALPVHLKGT